MVHVQSFFSSPFLLSQPWLITIRGMAYVTYTVYFDESPESQLVLKWEEPCVGYQKWVLGPHPTPCFIFSAWAQREWWGELQLLEVVAASGQKGRSDFLDAFCHCYLSLCCQRYW